MGTLKSFLLSAVAAVILIPMSATAQTGTALPDISPATIALDSKTEILGGVRYVTAPTFSPFETQDGLAGTASLRTGQGEISRDGIVLGDGAVLDLNLIYAAATNDPYDVRGFEQAVFLSGEPAESVRYDSRVLECSSRVTEVEYRDDYYAGVSHGLIAGIFMAYPRYRGHRGYGYRLGYSDYGRRPSWQRRNRGYSRGYGGVRRDRIRDTRRDARRDVRSDRDRDRDRDDRTGRRGGSDRVVAGETRRRTTGTRRGTGVGRPQGVLPGRTPDRPVADRSDRRSQGVTRGTSTRGTSTRERGADRRRDRVTTGRTITRSDETRRPVSRRDGGERIADGIRSEPSIRTPSGRSRGVSTSRSSSRSAPRPVSRPAPTVRQTPKPASRPQPKPSRRSEPKSAPKPSRRSTPKPSRVDRSTDRAFSGGSRGKPRRGLDYYPTGTRVETSVSGRCAKEESLGLFIPAERLSAARFDGMTVIVLGRDGTEIPVFIPPNYIEGFRQASSGVVQAQPRNPAPYGGGR